MVDIHGRSPKSGACSSSNANRCNEISKAAHRSSEQQGALAEIPPGVFICACEGHSGDMVQSILQRWGWEENPDRNGKKFDLKWANQVRFVVGMVSPATQLVNHFRGTDFLNHKTKMARYLNRCQGCADLFFPRQYDVFHAWGLREFIRDYIVTAAASISARQPDEERDSDDDAVRRKVALKVLSRHQPDNPEAPPLLRCVHECEALLGKGHQMPPKQAALMKARLFSYFGNAGCQEASCACQSDQATPKSPSKALHLQQESLNGAANAWVVKNPRLSRGRSVTIHCKLRNILTRSEQSMYSGLEWNAIVQKYVEKPLLVPREGAMVKADLRVWVLVLDWNPLVAFAHPEVYFRVATRPYTFQGFGEEETDAHATNVTNCQGGQDNRITLNSFLAEVGPAAADLWKHRSWPLLLDAVRATLLAVRDGFLGADADFQAKKKKPDSPTGPHAFELFGFDFALDDSWKPWLLEANSSPNMLRSCEVPGIKEWAENATESMLRIALLYHAKKLQLPKPSELDVLNRGDADMRADRLFPDELHGRHCEGDCYGAAVTRIPQCLVSGLDLGLSFGGWLLILRERLADAGACLKSYATQEAAVWQNPSAAKCCGHTRVLRDWLLPNPATPTPLVSQSTSDQVDCDPVSPQSLPDIPSTCQTRGALPQDIQDSSQASPGHTGSTQSLPMVPPDGRAFTSSLHASESLPTLVPGSMDPMRRLLFMLKPCAEGANSLDDADPLAEVTTPPAASSTALRSSSVGRSTLPAQHRSRPLLFSAMPSRPRTRRKSESPDRHKSSPQRKIADDSRRR